MAPSLSRPAGRQTVRALSPTTPRSALGSLGAGQDPALALSVVDESDVLLFPASSDGIHEESFQAMKALRNQNKPVLFVRNVKRDLARTVYLRRFLRDPSCPGNRGSGAEFSRGL